MREFVGVRSCFEKGNFGAKDWFSSNYSSSLKSQALLFDRIGIVNLESYLIPVRISEPENPHLLNLEFLRDKGIVFDYNTLETIMHPHKMFKFHEFLAEQGMEDYPMEVNKVQREKLDATRDFVETGQSFIQKKLDKLSQYDPNNPADFDKIEEFHRESIQVSKKLLDQLRERLLKYDSGVIRLVSMWMKYFDNSEVIPLLPYQEYFQEIPGSKKTDVINIVIKELPVPNEMTSWERIVEYRDSQYFYDDRQDLRGWITTASYSNLPADEIQQQLELLIKKYKKHLELHHIETKNGILETLIKVPISIFSLDKLSSPLFYAKRRQISLLKREAEYEISYIVKTQDEFME